MESLGILDLLSHYGFDRAARAKLVRHQHDKYPVEELMRQGWLETYQGYQSQPVFDNLDYVVSLYGLKGTLAGLYGVYKVESRRPASEGPTPADCPLVDHWRRDCSHFYELRRLPGFEDLERRLVIDWGKGALA